MATKFIIEGQTVRHIEETLVAEAPIESLIPHLVTLKPVTHPILPSVAPTRALHYDENGKRGALLIEQQPTIHTIPVYHRSGSFTEDAARHDENYVSRFKVAIPYHYFFFTFKFDPRNSDFLVYDGYHYWRKEPFRKYDDPLYIAPVPNVGRDGGICWGTTLTAQPTLSEQIDAMVNEYYITTFNEDLGHRTPFGTSLTQWEANSVEPLAYLNWDWWDTATSVTFENMLEQTSQGERNIIDLSPSHVEMPAIPESFTAARAAEWFNGLTEAAQQRVLLGLRDVLNAPETTNEPA